MIEPDDYGDISDLEKNDGQPMTPTPEDRERAMAIAKHHCNQVSEYLGPDLEYQMAIYMANDFAKALADERERTARKCAEIAKLGYIDVSYNSGESVCLPVEPKDIAQAILEEFGLKENK